MKLIWGRKVGVGVAAAACTALLALAASPAGASPLFCGGGYGPTADAAIQSALWDAQSTAQSQGFYGDCTIVGQPEIFETTNDPNHGHIFSAQLTASCLP